MLVSAGAEAAESRHIYKSLTANVLHTIKLLPLEQAELTLRRPYATTGSLKSAHIMKQLIGQVKMGHNCTALFGIVSFKSARV